MTEHIYTDEELFSAMQLGDKKAFNRIYDRYWEIIFKKAYIFLHDADAAGEVVNDIFLNIWLKRDLLQVQNLRNYLTASARYGVYNQLKLKKRSNLMYIDNYDALKDKLISDNQTDSFSSADIYQQVNKLLDHLPKRCKEIFLLSRFAHLSNSEIATKLEISKRTVENQLSLAVKHLRSNLGNALFLLLILKA